MKFFKQLIEETSTKIEYKSDEFAKNHLDSHFKDISASHPDKNPIMDYISVSKGLNNSLIDGQYPTEDNLETHRAIHRNSRPVGEHLTVYSGSGINLEEVAKKSKDGIVHLPAHTSTSTSEVVASAFGHKNRINLKPDDKGLYVNHLSSLGEKELILPAKTRLKYHGRDELDTPTFSVHSQEEPELFKDPKKATSDSVVNLTGARKDNIQFHIRRLQDSEHYTPQMHEFLLGHFSNNDPDPIRSDIATHQLLKSKRSTTPDAISYIKSLSETSKHPTLIRHVLRHIETTPDEYSNLLRKAGKSHYDQEDLLPKESIKTSPEHMHAFIDHFGKDIKPSGVRALRDRDFTVDHIRKIAKNHPAALAQTAIRALTEPSSAFNHLSSEEQSDIHEKIIASKTEHGAPLVTHLLSNHAWKPSEETTQNMIKNHTEAFFMHSPHAHKYIEDHLGRNGAVDGYLSNVRARHSPADLFKRSKSAELRNLVANHMNYDDKEEILKDPLVTTKKKDDLLSGMPESSWSKAGVDHVIMKSKNDDLKHRLLTSRYADRKIEASHIDHILSGNNSDHISAIYHNDQIKLNDKQKIAAIAHGHNQSVFDRFGDHEGPHPLNIEHALKEGDVNNERLAASATRITPEQLERLSNSQDSNTKRNAVGNRAATPEQVTSWLQRKVGKDGWKNQHVDSIAAFQRLNPSHVDQLLANHDGLNITSNLLGNRHANLRPDHIDHFLNHKTVDFQYDVLKRPEITPEHINSVLSSKTHTTHAKELAAEHPNTSDENISNALKSPHHNVRFAAIYNPNAQIHHLKVGLEDDNYDVSKGAARRLERLLEKKTVDRNSLRNYVNSHLT